MKNIFLGLIFVAATTFSFAQTTPAAVRDSVTKILPDGKSRAITPAAISRAIDYADSVAVNGGGGVGSQRPIRPQGVTGPVGPQGPTGPQGLAGTMLNTLNALDNGFVGNGTTNNANALHAIKGSNRSIFFPSGTYLFPTSVEWSGFSNVKFLGEPGTVFVTPTEKVLTLSGAVSNIEIEGIEFRSTKVSATRDTEGLIFIANYGTNDTMNVVRIHHCKFTNLNGGGNGIKVVSEGTNSLIYRIEVEYNDFDGIPSFGVEFQNHNTTVVAVRFRNFKINNNTFNDIGRNQAGTRNVAPSCISVSGYMMDGEANYNYANNMHMDTSPFVYYFFENAGVDGMQSIGNHVRSSTYGYTAFLGSGPDDAAFALGVPRKNGWILANNVITLTGSTSDKTKIRGFDISNADGVIAHHNTVRTDGICFLLQNSKDGKISDNFFKSTFDRPIYVTAGSVRNGFKDNTAWTLKSGDGTCLMFDGATTANNYTEGNTLIRADGTAGDIFLANGAPKNNKYTGFSTEPVRFNAPNQFQDAFIVSGFTTGETRFGPRTISAYTAADVKGNPLIPIYNRALHFLAFATRSIK